MELTEHSGISIAQIILFTVYLVGAVVLCIRHGWGQKAGWLLLVTFSLARIVGGALQLAAAAQPDNISLRFAGLALQNAGLSDLIITLLSLLKRPLESIERNERNTHNARHGCGAMLISSRVIDWAQVLMLIGVILGAVGDSFASSHYRKTGVYEVQSLSMGGVGLIIAGFVLLILATAIVGLNISHADPGEKRIVLAVALSLPFLLVRVVYSAIGILGQYHAFQPTTTAANVNFLLGLAAIEEIIIVAILEAIGLTLKIRPPPASDEAKISEPTMAQRLFGFLRGRYERRLDHFRGGYQMQRLNPESPRASV